MGNDGQIAFPESFCETFIEDITYDEDEKNTGYFELEINKEKFQMKIVYRNRKFRINTAIPKEKEKINDRFKKANDDVAEIRSDAASYITKFLVFRVINEEGYFYTENNFYKPSIPLWGEKRFENLGVLYGLEDMARVQQEKEIKDNTDCHKEDRWHDDTLFGFIDSLKNDKNVELFNSKYNSSTKPFFCFDALLCDDGSGELADFIGYSLKERKIVLIHAKMATTEKTLSSISFEKVADQVVKNLRAFDPYNFDTDDIVTKWEYRWPGKENGIINRIRKGDNPEIFRNELFDLLRKAADREVWIMYGNGFSARELNQELNSDNPNYYVRHLAYSLMNCNEAVGRFSAKLKIFTNI